MTQSVHRRSRNGQRRRRVERPCSRLSLRGGHGGGWLAFLAVGRWRACSSRERRGGGVVPSCSMATRALVGGDGAAPRGGGRSSRFSSTARGTGWRSSRPSRSASRRAWWTGEPRASSSGRSCCGRGGWLVFALALGRLVGSSRRRSSARTLLLLAPAWGRVGATMARGGYVTAFAGSAVVLWLVAGLVPGRSARERRDRYPTRAGPRSPERRCGIDSARAAARAPAGGASTESRSRAEATPSSSRAWGRRSRSWRGPQALFAVALAPLVAIVVLGRGRAGESAVALLGACRRHRGRASSSAGAARGYWSAFSRGIRAGRSPSPMAFLGAPDELLRRGVYWYRRAFASRKGDAPRRRRLVAGVPGHSCPCSGWRLVRHAATACEVGLVLGAIAGPRLGASSSTVCRRHRGTCCRCRCSFVAFGALVGGRDGGVARPDSGTGPSGSRVKRTWWPTRPYAVACVALRRCSRWGCATLGADEPRRPRRDLRRPTIRVPGGAHRPCCLPACPRRRPRLRGVSATSIAWTACCSGNLVFAGEGHILARWLHPTDRYPAHPRRAVDRALSSRTSRWRSSLRSRPLERSRAPAREGRPRAARLTRRQRTTSWSRIRPLPSSRAPRVRAAPARGDRMPRRANPLSSRSPAARSAPTPPRVKSGTSTLFPRSATDRAEELADHTTTRRRRTRSDRERLAGRAGRTPSATPSGKSMPPWPPWRFASSPMRR